MNLIQNYFEDIKSRKSSKNSNENPHNIIFKIVFCINHLCYPNKEKMYKLFVYSSNIFSIIDPNEHIFRKIFYYCHGY